MEVSTIRRILSSLQVRPSKGRGQNFLFDDVALSQVVNFAHVREGDSVLEVGPGLGVLSRQIASRVRLFRAVEIQPEFADFLITGEGGLQPEQIIRQDVLALSLDALMPLLGDGTRWTVVANVPYSISTQVILWLLRERRHICRANLLLQREFAERVAAGPGSRAYGSLSVFRALFADASLGPVIPGTSFYPEAEVESRLIEIRMHEPGGVEDDAATGRIEQIVEYAFFSRRKTLLNSLANAGLPLPKTEISARLERIGIDPRCRAETLSVDQFRDLAAEFQAELSKKGK